ncbi:MAG: hypothetical protein AAF655_28290, partial [Bacteroidota bacterium]
MRTTLLVAFLLAIFAQMSGQPITQKGVSRKINSDKKPVSGVFIKFVSTNQTRSGDDGVFTLTFNEKKVGDPIFLESIRKVGWEVVNEKDLEALNLSNTGKLKVDIIMAPAGLVAQRKREYYDISEEKLIARFQEEKGSLLTRLQKATISEQQYRDSLGILQERYDTQKENLDRLADKFARVNFDDVEPYYQKALELYKDGQIEEAIQTLEATNPAQRTEEIIQEEKRLDEAQED